MRGLFEQRHCLFEFCDQPWLKGWLREAYVDCLNFVLKVPGIYAHMLGPYSQWAAGTRSDKILDLASGGGGPIDTLLRNAEKTETPLPQILLSDLFPDIRRYKQLECEHGTERISYLEEKTDATEISQMNSIPRSICSAFHHFSEEQARRILEDSAKNSSGIFLMEPLQRDLPHFLFMILSGPFLGMLTPFFSHRFSVKNLLVCTLIPIIPLMVQFDGIISVLRSYNNEEICALFPDTEREHFVIRSGTVRLLGFWGSTYFYAYKKHSQ